MRNNAFVFAQSFAGADFARTALAPRGQYDPAGHSVRDTYVVPSAAQKYPGSHAAHACSRLRPALTLPYVPTGQSVSVLAGLQYPPTGHSEPGGVGLVEPAGQR